MKRIAVCLCTLLLPLPAAGQANPLAPLAKLHAAFTKGMGAVIKGTDVAKAFKPLTVKARPGLVEVIKEAGGVTARVLAMEIELIFYSEETASYYLRTEVYPAKRGPVLLSFKGRPSEGASKGFPFAKYRGYAAPLGAAGAILAKIAVGPACAKLPVATAADFPFMPPGKLTERMSHDLKKTGRHLADECAKLAELKGSRVELRVDDVVFGILGADGKLVGTVKGQLELEKGALALEIGRFKRMEMAEPPPPPPPPPRRGHHRPHQPPPGEPVAE